MSCGCSPNTFVCQQSLSERTCVSNTYCPNGFVCQSRAVRTDLCASRALSGRICVLVAFCPDGLVRQSRFVQTDLCTSRVLSGRICLSFLVFLSFLCSAAAPCLVQRLLDLLSVVCRAFNNARATLCAVLLARQSRSTNLFLH